MTSRQEDTLLIRNIVFDMGNVLIRYDAAAYVQNTGLPEPDQRLLLENLFRSYEWMQLDRGTLTDEAALASVCRRLPPHLHQIAQQLLENWHQDIPPLPEMELLAQKLKEAGYSLYLLSNTSAKYHYFRKNIPALNYFDGEFISADWHLLKPEVEIYRAFCHHFSLVPAQCFFIDDVAANIEGAMRAGMRGFVYHGSLPDLAASLAEAGVIY